MAASEDTARRGGRSLLTVLFWVGVGLAPLAMALLLFGQGNGPLRIAAVLAVLSVVLIGLSVALRSDSETVRQDLEEVLYEEVDGLHTNVRDDIATAARATHRAFGEKLQVLQGQVEALRDQLQAARAELVGAGPDGSEARAHVRNADVSSYNRGGPGSYEGAGRGGPAPYEGADRVAPAIQVDQPVNRASPAPAAPGADVGSFEGQQEMAAPAGRTRVGGRATVTPTGAAEAPPAPMSGGVLQHTETFHVTTRHTIVGPHGDGGSPGTMYGGNVYGRAGHGDQRLDADPDATSRGARVTEPGDSWTGQRPDDAYGRDGGRAPRYDPDGGSDGDARWSGIRAGDRWASARADDHGHELRLGERRAAVRADGTGTEVRIEDRWAAVRREEGRHEEFRRGNPRPHGARQDGAWQEGGRQDGAWQDGAWTQGARQEEGQWSEAAGPEAGRRRDESWVEDGMRGAEHQDGRRWHGGSERGEPVPDQPHDGYYWRDQRPPERQSGRDAVDGRGDGRSPRGGAPALPASPAEPPGPWNPPSDGWGQPPGGWSQAPSEREPEREPVRRGRSERDEMGYVPADETLRPGASRRLNFEPSDARWG